MADQNLTYDPVSTLNVDPAIIRDRLENGSMRDMVDMSQLDAVAKPVSGDYQIDTSTTTDAAGKDLMDYFKSAEAHPVVKLSKPQKDAASAGFQAYTSLNMQMNALPGQQLPNDFELPAYSEIYAPIFAEQFPAMKTPDDLIAHGLVDDNGQTEKGKFLLDLKKIGGLNNDYTLNITGKALLSNHEESLKPENLPIFMERKRLGLDEPAEKSWGTVWDELKGVLGKTVEVAQAVGEYNLSIGFGSELPSSLPPDIKKTQEDRIAKNKAILEGAASGIVKTESALASGARKIVLDTVAKMTLDGRERDMVLAGMDQEFQRTQLQNQAYKASESFHAITGLTNWVDQMEQAKTQLGDEGFKKAQQTGEMGGPMLFALVNPAAPENMAFHAGAAAVAAPFRVAGGIFANSEMLATRWASLNEKMNAARVAAAKASETAKFSAEQIPQLEKAHMNLYQASDIAGAKGIYSQIENLRTVGQKAVFEAEQWGTMVEEVGKQVDSLTSKMPVVNRINSVADTFRAWPKLVTTPVGYTLQKVGQGMTAIDSKLSAASDAIGAGKFYRGMTKWSNLAGLGALGPVAGLPKELAWFPTAFKAAWATAPFIEATGDFIRVVGHEASQARGASRMWQRVGQMQNAGPTHRLISGLMDTVTLGNLPIAQAAAKGAVAGTIGTVPVDMAFRYLSSGGQTDVNTFKESLVGTAFFATLGGGAGALKMGSQKIFKQLQMGDVLNFRRSITDPQQRMMFDVLPRGVRDSIGSYSASNPNLEVIFTKEGGGHIDPNKPNTIYINPFAKNPLKPLVAHEILESMVVHSNMSEAIKALLVGDGVQTGGLLRDRNGNLDPDFIKFRDRYNQLREADVNRNNSTAPPEQRETFKPLTDRDMAKEYFIEMFADDMAGMAESGKLGRIATRSAGARKMIDLGNSIFNKSSIIRNLHFNLGGMMDSSGKMVMGNGLLADGIRQLPEAKALFNEMVNNTAGRPGAAAKVSAKSKGSVIPTSGMNDPLWGEMTAYWKTDKAGNPIKDSNGNWVPIERHVEQAREQAGLLIQADQKQRIANGETIPKHEIQYSPETGTWRGKYFSQSQIEMIKNTGYFNDSQIRLFEQINNAAKRGQGERFLMIYNPATSSRLRGRGRKSYETLGPTMKEGGILGFSMGQKGQLLIDIIDTQQLHQNIMEQAGKKLGLRLYKGNIDKIMSDINAVMELHAEGKPADLHFQKEYGTEWKDHKDFINSTFGDISGGAKARPAEYQMINPVLVADRPSNAVFKTYRLDRLNKATAMEGTTGVKMDYNMVKANYMPDGTPLFHENGDPVDMRYTPVEDENGNLRAVPSKDYGKQNGVAPEEAISQNQQEPSQPTKPNAENTTAGVYERSIRNEPDVGRKFLEGITRTASDHPMGAAVEVKDASFYDDPNTRLFLAPDNLAGVAVTSYGDLVSVFSNNAWVSNH